MQRLGWIVLLLPTLALAQETVAEKTAYKETSRYADVVAFGVALAKDAPSVQLNTIGKSGEGRDIPLWVIANPPVRTPEEASKSGKLVTLLFANIHAGEVDGKEAVQMLARDVLRGPTKDLLKELIVLIVPILNVDGNEKIDPKNRAEQNGPSAGVGTRANAAGYDLNRDFVKLETPEIRGLVNTINRWDPALVVDLHTTNGSYHRYTLTYDGPRNAAADPDMIATVRDRWLPTISTNVAKATGYQSFFYGNFNRDRTTWDSYAPVPRFGVQWLALRNRIGLLSESYSYASFKDRVLVSKAFAEQILTYAAAHPADVRKLLANAEKPRDRIAVRTKVVSLGERQILGYVEEEKDGKRTPTKEHKTYTVAHMNGSEAAEIVVRPYAYLFPATCTSACATLQRHGIIVEELSATTELDVQIYDIVKFSKAERAFQQHNEVSVDVERREAKVKIPAGTRVIRTEQKLGQLAAYLLEPRAEDGLTTWNFFDTFLQPKAAFPVQRVPNKTTLRTQPLRAAYVD